MFKYIVWKSPLDGRWWVQYADLWEYQHKVQTPEDKWLDGCIDDCQNYGEKIFDAFDQAIEFVRECNAE